MFKFLLKLAIIGIVVYGLVQIPFFNKYVQELRASIMEKVQNVTNEGDRIQGKIEGAEKTIDDTTQKVTSIADRIKNLWQRMMATFTTIDRTADELKKVVTNEPAVAEGSAPSPTTPKLPTTAP